MASLRRWWTNKYKQPWTFKVEEEFTVYDLLVEFYEDHFSNDKKAMYEAISKDGHIRLAKTGDPLIDKWEEELANGLDPDLTEGLPIEERMAALKAKELYCGVNKTEKLNLAEWENFKETYGSGSSDLWRKFTAIPKVK